MKKQKEPKYLQLKEILKKQILSGNSLKAIDFIPNLKLQILFQLARSLLSEALGEYKKEGE